MFPIGVIPLSQAWMPNHAIVKLAIAIPSVVLLALCFSYASTKQVDDDAPTPLPRTALGAIWPFFGCRFDFLRAGYLLTKSPIFQFNILQYTVIAVSGEPARRDFLTNRGLDINEGFKVLSGAIPMVPGVTSDLQARRISVIHKRLATAQNSDRLSSLLPKILQDCQRVVCSWGQSGTVDPFTCVPALLFQTTVRSLTCDEIADDKSLVDRLRHLYDTLDTSTTPVSVLAPWLPSPSMMKKLLATKRVYDIVTEAINKRIQNGTSRDDTLQMLVDSGDDRLVIIGFIMGLLVAGARSTGTTASWMITFLAGHTEWKIRAKAEIQQLLSKYSTAPKSTSLTKQLANIPLEAWEGEMPVCEQIIRETLRVAQPHTAMRKNIGPDIYIAGTRIPSGAYVVYPFSDVHLDPQLYPDPWRFDPSREERKIPFTYIGWGGGRTVCLGQRLAKLQLKLVLASLFCHLDFTLVDQTGQIPNPLPCPNWNDALTCKPPKDSCYLRIESHINNPWSGPSSH